MKENAARGGGDTERSLAVRAVWFLLVGWWATGIWLGVAWFLNVTIIGIPIGIKMINKVPKVLSLKERDLVDAEGGSGEQPYGLAVRGVYFVFVGWWASGVWMSVAYLFTLSIVGLPVAVLMYNKLPFVVSLYEY
ncbi:YccF domain-containing protein [Haloparvum sedimenti]|uniref:YccF domain-containing protein n=1 Tax=Haloparvum sedimenti TaxID=1678448 RepID=UPI00071E84EC|nr:YccF domain-containing protein [Haloparvum sedimenti]